MNKQQIIVAVTKRVMMLVKANAGTYNQLAALTAAARSDVINLRGELARYLNQTPKDRWYDFPAESINIMHDWVQRADDVLTVLPRIISKGDMEAAHNALNKIKGDIFNANFYFAKIKNPRYDHLIAPLSATGINSSLNVIWGKVNTLLEMVDRAGR